MRADDMSLLRRQRNDMLRLPCNVASTNLACLCTGVKEAAHADDRAAQVPALA